MATYGCDSVGRSESVGARNFPVTFSVRILSFIQVNENSSRFWQLLESEHPRARAYCNRLTANAEEGDDLYQDAVIKAHNGFAGLRNQEAFRPWLYSIINNTFRGRFNNPWWKRILAGTIDLEQLAGGQDPSGAYTAKRRLEYAFAALSADDRIIVTLADLEGWKTTELAELLNKSDGFIKMRLSRARAKMRDRLLSLRRKTAAAKLEEGVEALCCVTKPKED